MSNKKQTVKTKSSDMFFLAAVAFLLLLVEPMLITLLNASGFALTIIYRTLCVVIWAFGAMGLIKTAKKECNLDILKREKPLSPTQWTIISVATAAIVAYFIWGKLDIFKVIGSNITSIKTDIAYISMLLLNVSKAGVITIFLAFIQKGLKKAKWIPLGGIALGLIWCIMFLLSSVGATFHWTYPVYQFAYGLALGVLFVLSGNKPRYAFPFIAIATVLIFLS